MNTLTPKKFDEAVAPKNSLLIWTAAAIGRRIGRSPDYVRRTLAGLEGTPVRRQGRGNFYAVESELVSFWARLGRGRE